MKTVTPPSINGKRVGGSRSRPGFTLLEVLLASLIAILLLAALYYAMDITLRQTYVSRETTDVENLSRGVFNRMYLDLSCSLGPLPPKSGGNSASGTNGSSSSSSDPSMMSGTTPTTTSAAPATGATGGGTAGATTAAPSATAAPATSDPTASSTDSEAPVEPQAADIAFQGGIVGYENQLTVFVSQLPPALANTGELLMGSDPSVPGPSDLWRITYWLGQNGLCRQVRPWVTADGVRNSTDPDLTTEASDTLVPEVTEVLFEYWDGTGWVTSWDGTTPGPDGITPTGPPRAIRVTLGFSVSPARAGGIAVSKSVVQVIPVRTAPGLYTPTMIDPSTDPGTVTPEDASSSGSTGSTGGTGGSGSTSPTPTQNAPSTPAASAPSAPAQPASGGGGAGGASMGGGRSGGTGGGR